MKHIVYITVINYYITKYNSDVRNLTVINKNHHYYLALQDLIGKGLSISHRLTIALQ